jgi:hypothetical protein
MNFLSLVILLTLPFNIEFLLNNANSQSNMGLYGVYLEIYRTRNILYFSSLLLFISIFYGYVNYALLAFIASLCVFLRTVHNWKPILLENCINNVGNFHVNED